MIRDRRFCFRARSEAGRTFAALACAICVGCTQPAVQAEQYNRESEVAAPVERGDSSLAWATVAALVGLVLLLLLADDSDVTAGNVSS